MIPVSFDNCNQSNHPKITVVGIAGNDKDAAIVETDNGHYIVGGLDAWPDKYYGKRVQVSGRLVKEVHEQKSTPTMAVQERVGTWLIIKHAKWKFLE
jgi:hypothetical protein